MERSILDDLLLECPFQETLDCTERVEGCMFPVPKYKIGHIRADYDGWRWYNTVWPCHKELSSIEASVEIDRMYDRLIASNALKDLFALRKFCSQHMDACVSKEQMDEFNFFYEGDCCNYWIRLITRKGDYNLYLNAYVKAERQKYFAFLERLRQSGETNMYGAAPYLQEKFPELRYVPEKAQKILTEWFASFERTGEESK